MTGTSGVSKWRFTVIRLAVVVCLFVSTGVDYTPRLHLTWKNGMMMDDMIRDAPIILLGTVLRQEPVGAIRDGCRLVRVHSTVENVLKGHFASRAVEFYFYSPWLGASGDWNFLHDGNRYIQFLTLESGKFRAIRDYWRSSIRVYSGRHATTRGAATDNLQRRIATLLLTPGDDLEGDEFSVGLLHSTSWGEVWLGKSETVDLIRSLLRHPNQSVRVGACEELTLRFRGFEGCWDTVDFGNGSLLRSRYGVIAPAMFRKSHRHWISKATDADVWWATAKQRYTSDELLDELKLMTMVDDAETRVRFCRLLNSRYSGQAPHCVLK